MTEQPHLDLTPYSEENLRFLREVTPWVQEVWTPLEVDGISVRLRPGRFGVITELWIDGFCWMNTNPIDLLDHRSILDFKGSVIATGFGLGLAVVYALRNPNITRLTVVEKDERVIRHLWEGMVAQRVDHRIPVEVVHADADHLPAMFQEARFDCGFVDHAQMRPADAVVARYAAQCDRLVVWYDEVQKCQM